MRRICGSFTRLTEVSPEIIYGSLRDYLADADLLSHLHDQVLRIGAGAMATILKRAAGYTNMR